VDRSPSTERFDDAWALLALYPVGLILFFVRAPRVYLFNEVDRVAKFRLSPGWAFRFRDGRRTLFMGPRLAENRLDPRDCRADPARGGPNPPDGCGLLMSSLRNKSADQARLPQAEYNAG
jgi:hypothetical protein